MKEATLCPRLSLQQRQFNLVREDCEMTVEPVKQLALGLVRGEIADQGAFGCVFSQLFDLREMVLHVRCPDFVFSSFDPGITGVNADLGIRTGCDARVTSAELGWAHQLCSWAARIITKSNAIHPYRELMCEPVQKGL